MLGRRTVMEATDEASAGRPDPRRHLHFSCILLAAGGAR
jgi:hypothetical protein